MRKSDAEVREVVCSETGKPMPKIPLWMADVTVKFVSDEARQRHSPSHGVAIEPARRAFADDVKEADADPDVEEADADFEEEPEAEEVDEDEFGE